MTLTRLTSWEAEDEMKSLAQSNPEFLLAKFAIEGWERWASPFILPPWDQHIKGVHPAIAATVKTNILLAVRDGLMPRATLFLRDAGGDFQNVDALKSARIDIATVISPITNPQVVGIYGKIWDNPGSPFNLEALGVPVFPRGHKGRATWECLCIQQDIDCAVIDRQDRILLNKRLPMPGNMRLANQVLLKLLKASPGKEISVSEMMNAVAAHQGRISPSNVQY